MAILSAQRPYFIDTQVLYNAYLAAYIVNEHLLFDKYTTVKCTPQKYTYPIYYICQTVRHLV